ncbi:MAG: hypothetical protein EOO85_20250, partial [Pedobacter sp.]
GGNGKGGAQECFGNKGAGSNEFRLGNECGIYGEFSLGGYILKADDFCEFSAKNRFIELECFFCISIEVDPGINCFHNKI